MVLEYSEYSSIVYQPAGDSLHTINDHQRLPLHYCRRHHHCSYLGTHPPHHRTRVRTRVGKIACQTPVYLCCCRLCSVFRRSRLHKFFCVQDQDRSVPFHDDSCFLIDHCAAGAWRRCVRHRGGARSRPLDDRQPRWARRRLPQLQRPVDWVCIARQNRVTYGFSRFDSCCFGGV